MIKAARPKNRTREILATAVVLLSVIVMFVNIFPAQSVGAASLQDQLNDVQRKLDQIAQQKAGIQNTVNQYNNQANSYAAQTGRLSNEISLLDVEASEKQLKIDELNLSIQLLQEEIDTSHSIISQTEFDVDSMQTQVDHKILGMYVDYKTGIGTSEIDASLDNQQSFKKLQYKSVLIDQTRGLVDELNKKIAQLEDEKKSLDDKDVQLKRDKQLIDEEKLALDSKKAQLGVQRQAFYNLQEQARRNGQAAQNQVAVLSDAEAQARAQAELLKQQIYNSVSTIPNGTFVAAGTIIGYQGCTGVCTGPHLHLTTSINGKSVNPCSKLPPGPFGGCSGDSTFKRWPFSGSYYFTSSYGNRCYGYNGRTVCRFHDGIDLAHPVPGAPVYAIFDGWYIRGKENGCYAGAPVCNNGGANYVILCQDKTNCNRGLKAGFWHLK